jgi:hypothetical protein
MVKELIKEIAKRYIMTLRGVKKFSGDWKRNIARQFSRQNVTINTSGLIIVIDAYLD